ncbi:hypothetical protein BCR42DRAFT_399035 [Absidia repens]|uniref:Uncharacterized protein n=1 Tax=Absidia repens TaxID=90262 RepID=A0A1X2HLT3_9FUNG|nr:hypothetical protein BCR42DRAFT_399035 [Absidia repens]
MKVDGFIVHPKKDENDMLRLLLILHPDNIPLIHRFGGALIMDSTYTPIPDTTVLFVILYIYIINRTLGKKSDKIRQIQVYPGPVYHPAPCQKCRVDPLLSVIRRILAGYEPA